MGIVFLFDSVPVVCEGFVRKIKTRVQIDCIFDRPAFEHQTHIVVSEVSS